MPNALPGVVVRKIRGVLSFALASLLLGVIFSPPGNAATAGNSHPQTGMIVSDNPAGFTPHILQGTVYSIVQVGNMIVVGGSFSQVQPANGGAILTRRNIFAFNATSGAISTTFVPDPNSTVYKVQAAEDGQSVYVGGRFSSAYGVSMPSRLFKAHVAAGTRDPLFRPSTFSGDIRDLEVIGDRLWVAGKFTHIGGVAQRALGTINADDGKYNNFFTGVLAGTHRNPAVYTGDRTNVLQISSNRTNTQLVAVGNFTSVNGQARSQIAQIDISGASSYALAPWYTTLFTSSCSPNFDTIMTDVEYSPNGQFFVVSTTAAWGGMSSATGGNGCDVVARFESSSTSSASRATWTAYTGGDSTWTVEVTDNVVYVGGHQSWQNNPIGANVANQGAVSRPGIGGLNAVNGMPWSWNPTRTRGVGVQDMLATSQGLWVGSDTDRIGAYEYHARIALLPLAGGETLPIMSNPTLPATVYSVSSGGAVLNRREFTGTTATTPTPVITLPPSVSWGTTVGAFMSNGVLYTAASNGLVTKRTFDGIEDGTASPVNTADQLVNQTDWHNTDVPTLTSLFYYNGEIFFTRSGQTTMFRRGFEPESDIVGQQRFTIAAVSGINYSTIRGAFVANDKFYYSNTTGQLFRADWSGRSPVAGTSVQVSGPGRDTQNWASRSMFVYAGEAIPTENEPPTASATVTCTGLTCTFNGTASTDPENDIDSYAWTFGDPGQTGTGATTTHTYPSEGPRTVTLTVTDGGGETDTTTRLINPQNQPPTAAATVTCTGLTCTFNGTASSDPENDIDSYAWDFGDPGATGTGATTTHTYPSSGPRTVTLTVTDGVGETGTTMRSINPQNLPPTAAATVTCTGLTCTFNGTASTDPENDINAYAWDFGDPGETGTGATTTHTYPGPGPRIVTLTVTDGQGATGTTTRNIDPAVPPNQPPTAQATITCNLLECSYDGTASDDPDGDIEAYVWDFGDGETDSISGENATHTYAGAGQRIVTLTVTDDEGETDEFSQTISPSDVTSPISFIDSASTVGNRENHIVPIPAPVEAGDVLVVFFAANTTNPTYTGPAGWTQIGSTSGGGTAGRAYSKVATTTDAAAGATVRVTSSGFAKSQITVAAYRGTDATTPVAASASGQDAGGTAHTSPPVTAPAGSNWLVTYWADESSATSGWTAPGGQMVRNTLSHTGSGHMSGLLVDSNGPVSGNVGGLTAIANSFSIRGVSFSVVLH